MGARGGIMARWLRRLAGQWRQSIRMTVAALLAYAATALFGAHQGQWAVITCLVVVQASFANTWDASLSRVYGTVAGALTGGAGVVAHEWTGVPEAVMLGLALAPLAALAAVDQRCRLAHSDDCSHRFRLKPAAYSDRSQPGIPMIPAG